MSACDSTAGADEYCEPVRVEERSPLHVAIFLRSLYGYGGGGAERSIATLASELSERGHRVDLICARLTGEYLNQVSLRVRCIGLGARAGLFASPTLLRRPRLLAKLAPLGFGLLAPWVLGALPGLVSYLRRQRPDVLFSALSYPNLTAILAREIAGVPTRVVISERNTLSLKIKEAGAKRKWRALAALVPACYPMADVISAVSSGVATDLAKFIGVSEDRVEVTYNPVVTSELKEKAKEPLDHPWLQGDGPPVILGIGALRPQKDFESLIRAFSQLRVKREARLIILGEGPLRPDLEALVGELHLESDVGLVGFVPNPFAYLARASVFALSSRYEGLPGALVQAMACGCPVVSTDCASGPREILMEGELGALVPMGSSDALALAILGTLEHPVASQRLRERAEFFSVANSTERYLALLRPPS
jgi:glycosyltransferase involved in cell wall biosynthesis